MACHSQNQRVQFELGNHYCMDNSKHCPGTVPTLACNWKRGQLLARVSFIRNTISYFSKSDQIYSFLGGACIFFVGCSYTIWLQAESKSLLLGQCVLVLVSSINVVWTTHNFDIGQGLTWTNQIISWCIIGLFSCLHIYSNNANFIAVFSLIAPVVATPSFGCKMLSLSFSTSAIFVLLSVRHEVFFLFFLLVLLNLYPTVEMQVSAKLDFIEVQTILCSKFPLIYYFIFPHSCLHKS